MARKKTTKLNFEQALLNLEEVVAKLESNEQNLEESLQLFEQGIKYTRICQEALQQAEEKITVLSQQSSDWVVESEEDLGDFIEGSK